MGFFSVLFGSPIQDMPMTSGEIWNHPEHGKAAVTYNFDDNDTGDDCYLTSLTDKSKTFYKYDVETIEELEPILKSNGWIKE